MMASGFLISCASVAVRGEVVGPRELALERQPPPDRAHEDAGEHGDRGDAHRRHEPEPVAQPAQLRGPLRDRLGDEHGHDASPVAHGGERRADVEAVALERRRIRRLAAEGPRERAGSERVPGAVRPEALLAAAHVVEHRAGGVEELEVREAGHAAQDVELGLHLEVGHALGPLAAQLADRRGRDLRGGDAGDARDPRLELALERGREPPVGDHRRRGGDQRGGQGERERVGLGPVHGRTLSGPVPERQPPGATAAGGHRRGPRDRPPEPGP